MDSAKVIWTLPIKTMLQEVSFSVPSRYAKTWGFLIHIKYVQIFGIARNEEFLMKEVDE